jgi:hypothetical protein
MSRRSGRSKPYSQTEASEFPEEDEVNNYEAEGEDDIDDDQEVTRCVCGEDEVSPTSVNLVLADVLQKEGQIKIDVGLFIQCDKCSVWQHGYCVGLFANYDVPDKYWCELCKPDLHVFIYEGNEVIRTLYKPVNYKRRKVPFESLVAGQSTNKPKPRSKRLLSATAPSPPEDGGANDHKSSRKERRHYDDSYDEQLQKALRESAKESGLVLEESKKRKADANVSGSDSSSKSLSKRKKNVTPEKSKPKQESNAAESDNIEQDPSNLEDDDEDVEDKQVKVETVRRSKPRPRSAKPKKPKTVEPRPTNSKKNSSQDAAPMSKDELINQASKPRFVAEKSTVFELRKRTGAILEWLGRTQVELEEEKGHKIELFNYKEKTETNQHNIDDESNNVINNFNQNLTRMEVLTEKILSWEQMFGKYAP